MSLTFQLRGGTVYLTQEKGRVMYPVEDGTLRPAPCMWFALCDKMAVTTEPHPILGNVPICERCAARIDQE